MKKSILFLLLLVLSFSVSADAQKRKSKVRKKAPVRRTVPASPPRDYYPQYEPQQPQEQYEARQPQIEKFAYAVSASGLLWQPIYVQNSKRLIGRFTAQGGGRNDIYCYIVDDDGLTNLRNGNSAQTYFNSGNVTVGNFDITLNGSRQYYIVFKNYYIFGNKAVTMTLQQFGN